MGDKIFILQELDIVAVGITDRAILEPYHIPVGIGGIKHCKVCTLGQYLDDHVIETRTCADIERQTACIYISLTNSVLLCLIEGVDHGILPRGLGTGGKGYAGSRLGCRFCCSRCRQSGNGLGGIGFGGCLGGQRFYRLRVGNQPVRIDVGDVGACALGGGGLSVVGRSSRGTCRQRSVVFPERVGSLG